MHWPDKQKVWEKLPVQVRSQTNKKYVLNTTKCIPTIRTQHAEVSDESATSMPEQRS